MISKENILIITLLPSGWFGLHHYFLKNKLIMIFYILFIWTGIPILFSYINAIKFYRMNEKSYIKRYGSNEDYEKYVLEGRYNLNDSINNFDSVEKEDVEKEDVEKAPDYSNYYGPWMDKGK